MVTETETEPGAWSARKLLWQFEVWTVDHDPTRSDGRLGESV
jgi:hypothetical protein